MTGRVRFRGRRHSQHAGCRRTIRFRSSRCDPGHDAADFPGHPLLPQAGTPHPASGAEREGVPAAFRLLSGQLTAGDLPPPRNGVRCGRRPPNDVGQRRQLTVASAITAALGLENIRSWCLDLWLMAFTSSVPLQPWRPASSRKVHGFADGLPSSALRKRLKAYYMLATGCTLP
jgi:hypothetical protein